MSGFSGARGRSLVVALLLLATLAFGIGVAIEKAEEGERSQPAGAAAAPGAVGHQEETLLGIELESTPLVITGIVASLLLAAAVWRSGHLRSVLGLAALFCLAFAVLDGIEVGRKWGDEATIAGLALAALVLHGLAAVVAASIARADPDSREITAIGTP